jgi:hypothetical protein
MHLEREAQGLLLGCQARMQMGVRGPLQQVQK